MVYVKLAKTIFMLMMDREIAYQDHAKNILLLQS